jgi:peptide deformylase
MEILTYPDPFLRKRARNIPDLGDDLRSRIREMFDAMYAARGVGLAATQVGWDARLFVQNVTGEPEGEEVHIDPVILEQEGEVDDEEGCLSFPGLRGRVVRARRIRVRSVDIDGNPQEVVYEDLPARAVQHEIDHLDGILFIQRFKRSEQVRIGRQLKEMEREYKARQKEASTR